MHWFLKLIILPLLDALEPKVIVEVGVEVGAVTRPLLDWAREHDALLHSIDPDPNLNVEELTAEYGERLRFHREKSLSVLGELPAVDVALIDGDHNWYTVINELRALERRAVEDERLPPAVLLHDIGWPYGRRDLYYDPQSIPETDRQPHARMGIVFGQSELGVGLNDHLQNAMLEGTPANGVLTAVEDFVAESRSDWRSFSIPGLSGLAILVTDALLAEHPALGDLLARLDTPELLRAQCEAIERARIRSKLSQATLSRRLAETQLKQVMRRVDPEELVGLYARIRELEDQRRELERRLEAAEEDQAQLRLLSAELERAAASTETAAEVDAEPTAEDSAHSPITTDAQPATDTQPVVAPTNTQPAANELAAAENEHKAREIFLGQFLPVAEGALPDTQGRDPLALPSPLDPSGLLRVEGERQEPHEPNVDVIVCVHDALEDLRLCLWSLTHKTGRRFRLIVVDDGSEPATGEYLDAFAARLPQVTLIHRREPPHGYTLAANAGLRASSGDYVVLLNSDTVVTPGWLARIVARGEREERVGVLGPLSNAASHQSVPALRHEGAWATNALPDWLTVDGAALAARRGTPTINAHLPFLNGFCYAIKRAVIDAIGYLDEERFPSGYCEENDYSQRARDAGFELAVVEDAYVYHAKSRSFGPAGRDELAQRNYGLFRAKHGPEQIDALVASMEADTTLAPARTAFAQHTAEAAAFAELLAPRGERKLSVVFILPGLPYGGSGGSHSVYQEVKGLRGLGVPARIALPSWDWERARAAYPDADDVFRTFADGEELAATTSDADVISATHYRSVAMLKALGEARENFLPAYYVQDYEPFFTAPYIAEEAVASYTAVPGMLLFAKSHWLCNVVAERHGLLVEKVEPSIDERLFTSGGRGSDPDSGPLRIVAMVRPRTARRQPLGTVTVLERLQRELPGRVTLMTFGCYPDELREILSDARDTLDSHLGLLTRTEVADLLRRSEVFLDMSSYQAFGRTALEAMACGCTAVVPEIGGLCEFVEHGENALAVDTFDPDSVIETLASLVQDRDRLRRLQVSARATAARYSVARAAISEYLLFDRAHRARFGARAQATAPARQPPENLPAATRA
jgi:GT2 family glycosyltransferase/glycosyltransferase involved in cell wall biosynthesis